MGLVNLNPFEHSPVLCYTYRAIFNIRFDGRKGIVVLATERDVVREQPAEISVAGSQPFKLFFSVKVSISRQSGNVIVLGLEPRIVIIVVGGNASSRFC